MKERVQDLLDRIRDSFETTLGDDLAGIYVHGSLAFGCFSWNTGDIDLIIVVDNEPSHEQKRAIIRRIMEIEADAPPKGIEFSMLLRTDCMRFSHPMAYVMHYSKGHTARYIEDMDGHIRRLRGNDRDLAAHLTVMHAVGYPLVGPAVKDMFSEVPIRDYLDALLYDMEDASARIHDDPVYIILNLCRVLAFLKEDSVLSKADGGRWGMEHLPGKYLPVVRWAIESYARGECANELPESDALERFETYMTYEIARSSKDVTERGGEV